MYMVPRINYMIICPKFLCCKPGGMVWMRGVLRWQIDCDAQECESKELRDESWYISGWWLHGRKSHSWANRQVITYMIACDHGSSPWRYDATMGFQYSSNRDHCGTKRGSSVRSSSASRSSVPEAPSSFSSDSLAMMGTTSSSQISLLKFELELDKSKSAGSKWSTGSRMSSCVLTSEVDSKVSTDAAGTIDDLKGSLDSFWCSRIKKLTYTSQRKICSVIILHSMFCSKIWLLRHFLGIESGA